MASLVSITSNAREIAKALDKIPGALQKATAATLTDVARAATIRSERNIRRGMIVRTPYTTKSLRMYKASESKPIARQNSVSGTVSEYLPIHDEGGKIKAKRKAIAVPTNRVRGKDRKKKIPSRYKIDSMGNRAFILRPASPVKVLKRAGLFIRDGKKGKLRKVRDLGAKSYQLKAKRWHTEAVQKYGNWSYMAASFRRHALRVSKHLG